jgi:hypothetical protein
MDSITQWKEKIDTFIKLSNKHNVKMIMAESYENLINNKIKA